MAIAFNAETEDLSNTGTGPFTFSHTTAGDDRLLLVGVAVNDGTERITGVTYNGVAMTQLNKVASVTNASWEYLYGLVAPATGANNVEVSFSASVTAWFHAVSYTGVSQSGLPDATNTQTTTSGTSITTSVTTVADNCWLVGYARNFAGNVTAGTNFTLRSTAFPIAIGDSNGALTPAGSKSQTANSASDSEWTHNLVSIAPAGAASTFTPKATMLF